MEINAEQVRELREKSGAGIMDCKRALRENSGNLDQALDSLRRQGVIKAGKKAGRETQEGLVEISLSEDGQTAGMVEVNCETDFVARTDPFRDFLTQLARLAVSRKVTTLPDLMRERMKDGTVEESLQGLIARLGENMVVRRVAVVRTERPDEEKIGSYVHAGSKIGVLVRARGNRLSPEVVREVAMHIAAMHPVYIDRRGVPEGVVAKERDFLKSSTEITGKPTAIVEKIIEGKLTRYFSDLCLLEQPFVKDASGKKTVGSFLKGCDPAAEILEMVRYQVGSA